MSEPASYRAPRWAWWVATGFGSGRLRPAPGTWGSLAALLAWCGCMQIIANMGAIWGEAALTSAGRLVHPLLSFLPLAGTALGAWMWIRFGTRASTLYARELGLKDPSVIVIDEWAGMWISLIPFVATSPYIAPLGVLWHWADIARSGWSPWEDLAPVLVAFMAFRLFDIWKPWPCQQIQDLPDGEGIMADDVVAGLYAGLVVLVFLKISEWHLIPWPNPQQFWHH